MLDFHISCVGEPHDVGGCVGVPAAQHSAPSGVVGAADNPNGGGSLTAMQLVNEHLIGEQVLSGVNVHHITGHHRISLQYCQRAVQGLVRTQAAIGTASGRVTIHIPDGTGIVHIVGKSLVSYREVPVHGIIYCRIILIDNAPQALHRGRLGGYVPLVGARRRIQITGDQIPIDTVVAGVLQADRAGRQGSTRDPEQPVGAIYGAAIIDGYRQQPRVGAAAARFRSVTIETDIDPRTVRCRFVAV